MSQIINKEDMKALDCGCGTGYFALVLNENGFNITCLDISKEMINITKNKLRKCKNVKYIVGEAEKYFRSTNKKYDLISFLGVIHHIYDYETLFKLVNKHLNSGGLIYIAQDPRKIPDNEKDKWKNKITNLQNNCFNIYKAIRSPIYTIKFIYNVIFKKQINVGLAEYHGNNGGLDDNNVIKCLKLSGFKILYNLKYGGNLFRIFNIFGETYKHTFTIIAQKV
jgi:ubiquinone/menaquinone biosynthesis C-methylase UbiE